MKKILCLILALIMGMTLVACGSDSSDEVEKLKDENEKLKDENEKLEDENEKFKDKNEELKDENEELKEENEELKEELEKKATKHFVIATDKGFTPFEFEDEYGNVIGIDVDILAAIAEDQGFTYDLEHVGWDDAVAACRSGEADGMIAGASITETRKEAGWIFSDGYFEATQGMAVAKDSDVDCLEDLYGEVVAVKNGTMSNEYAESIKDEFGFEVVTYETSRDMYQAVITGSAVACFDDTPILKYSIKTGNLDMKFVEGTENNPVSYGFVIFDEEKQELIDLFNAGLKNIKENGTYDEIIKKYLG